MSRSGNAESHKSSILISWDVSILFPKKVESVNISTSRRTGFFFFSTHSQLSADCFIGCCSGGGGRRRWLHPAGLTHISAFKDLFWCGSDDQMGWQGQIQIGNIQNKHTTCYIITLAQHWLLFIFDMFRLTIV